MTTLHFTPANQARSEIGARRQVSEAHRALRILKRVEGHRATRRHPGRYDSYIEALVLRIENPHSTLEQIAATQQLTKNAYWSRLRRAFEYAAWFERNTA
jgi:DNA-binding transcriptional regulator WhiA